MWALSIAPSHMFDLYLIKQHKNWYSYMSLIHEYMSIWQHTLWEVFFNINNNIDNIYIEKNINNILIIREMVIRILYWCTLRLLDTDLGVTFKFNKHKSG
jgi:hypothetical protein